MWTICPNYPTRSDTNTNFISYSRALEFVGIPSWGEGRRLLDAEIGAIDTNIDIAMSSSVIFSKGPIDLWEKAIMSLVWSFHCNDNACKLLYLPLQGLI